MEQTGITLGDFAKSNRKLTEEKYRTIDEWSPTDWACAMGGECGEALNLVKKLRRLLPSFHPEVQVSLDQAIQLKALIIAIGREVADTVIYADLLCQRLGISLEDAVREKFNATSEEVGSDIRL